MQAVADEANVSVGLIYRYFFQTTAGQCRDRRRARRYGGARPLPPNKSTIPIRRLAVVLCSCRVRVVTISVAAVLHVRESHTLDAEGLQAIKDAEIRTAQPLVTALHEADEQGLIRPMNVSSSRFTTRSHDGPRVGAQALVFQKPHDIGRLHR